MVVRGAKQHSNVWAACNHASRCARASNSQQQACARMLCSISTCMCVATLFSDSPSEVLSLARSIWRVGAQYVSIADRVCALLQVRQASFRTQGMSLRTDYTSWVPTAAHSLAAGALASSCPLTQTLLSCISSTGQTAMMSTPCWRTGVAMFKMRKPGCRCELARNVIGTPGAAVMIACAFAFDIHLHMSCCLL